MKSEYRTNRVLFLFSDSAICPQLLETNSLRQHIPPVEGQGVAFLVLGKGSLDISYLPLLECFYCVI